MADKKTLRRAAYITGAAGVALLAFLLGRTPTPDDLTVYQDLLKGLEAYEVEPQFPFKFAHRFPEHYRSPFERARAPLGKSFPHLGEAYRPVGRRWEAPTRQPDRGLAGSYQDTFGTALPTTSASFPEHARYGPYAMMGSLGTEFVPTSGKRFTSTYYMPFPARRKQGVRLQPLRRQFVEMFSPDDIPEEALERMRGKMDRVRVFKLLREAVVDKKHLKEIIKRLKRVYLEKRKKPKIEGFKTSEANFAILDLVPGYTDPTGAIGAVAGVDNVVIGWGQLNNIDQRQQEKYMDYARDFQATVRWLNMQRPEAVVWITVCYGPETFEGWARTVGQLGDGIMLWGPHFFPAVESFPALRRNMRKYFGDRPIILGGFVGRKPPDQRQGDEYWARMKVAEKAAKRAGFEGFIAPQRLEEVVK